MTEPERIVASGIVPPNFLDEEVQCEFLVDSHRKKIWAVELELMLEIDRVCKKHNLRYFLMCGTLLGAILGISTAQYNKEKELQPPDE